MDEEPNTTHQARKNTGILQEPIRDNTRDLSSCIFGITPVPKESYFDRQILSYAEGNFLMGDIREEHLFTMLPFPSYTDLLKYYSDYKRHTP